MDRPSPILRSGCSAIGAAQGDLSCRPEKIMSDLKAWASRRLREAFGEDVVNHYVNNARVEVAAFNEAVTDWERVRGFERF